MKRTFQPSNLVRKRRHPNKGRWADWSLRRASARRREALHRAAAAGSVIEAGREEAD